MPSIEPISLDGSTLEGGGQLVRVALSLSAITGLPVHIYNIRANRAPQGRTKSTHGSKGVHTRKVEGGLKESHLAALQYLAYHCDAYVEGAETGSREVTFIPGAGTTMKSSRNIGGVTTRLIDFEQNTISLERPGSVWLILQAILPFLIFGKTRFLEIQKPQHQTEKSHRDIDSMIELTLHGGTNVSKSMSGEYVQNVLLPTLAQIGIKGVEVEIVKRGWAGSGAATIGEVKVRVPHPPATGFNLPAFDLSQRGGIEAIEVAMIGDMGVDRSSFEKGVKQIIGEHLGDLTVDFNVVEPSGDNRRFYLQLTARTSSSARISRDYLGTGRLPKTQAEAERMGQTAIETVVRELKAELKRESCVDEFMQDQLVIFQALADGESRVDGGKWTAKSIQDKGECEDVEGSLHTKTVRWVCKKMLGKVGSGVRFSPRGRCEGIEWNRQPQSTG